MIKSKIKMIIHTQNGILSFEKALKSEAGWANKFSDVGRLVAVGVGVTVGVGISGALSLVPDDKTEGVKRLVFSETDAVDAVVGVGPKETNTPLLPPELPPPLEAVEPETTEPDNELSLTLLPVVDPDVVLPPELPPAVPPVVCMLEELAGAEDEIIPVITSARTFKFPINANAINTMT